MISNYDIALTVIIFIIIVAIVVYLIYILASPIKNRRLNEPCNLNNLCSPGFICSGGVCKIPLGGSGCTKDSDCAFFTVSSSKTDYNFTEGTCFTDVVFDGSYTCTIPASVINKYANL